MGVLIEIHSIHRILNTKYNLAIFLLGILVVDPLSIICVVSKYKDTISDHLKGFLKIKQVFHLLTPSGPIVAAKIGREFEIPLPQFISASNIIHGPLEHDYQTCKS